jgi:hypothetical protein
MTTPLIQACCQPPHVGHRSCCTERLLEGVSRTALTAVQLAACRDRRTVDIPLLPALFFHRIADEILEELL